MDAVDVWNMIRRINECYTEDAAPDFDGILEDFTPERIAEMADALRKYAPDPDTVRKIEEEKRWHADD